MLVDAHSAEGRAVSDLTPEDRAHLEAICAAVRGADSAYFAGQGVEVGCKGGYWVLNYGQWAPRTVVNRLTRGLVVEETTGRIVSFPFVRFHNFGEPEADGVDFARADLLEKLDGTMVGVCFPHGTVASPLWHTRKMVSAHDGRRWMTSFRGEKFPIMEEIGRALEGVRFGTEDGRYSLMFELVSPYTRVVTRYEPPQMGLYLIGGRDLEIFREPSEDELDTAAARLGVRRPRRWDALASHADILALLEGFPDDFEGFVARERNSSRRVKLKKSSYVAIHHMLPQLNYRFLLPVFLKGEEAEVAAAFREAGDRLDRIRRRWQPLVDRLAERVLHWKRPALNRKELALRLTGRVYGIPGVEDPLTRGVIFALHTLAEEDVAAGVERYLRALSVPRLLEVLQLRDESD
jgi:hypothetical protein